MRHALFLTAALGLWLGSITSSSAACDPNTTSCLGATCTQLGETKMDGEGKNILACLNSDSGMVWKAQTQATSLPTHIQLVNAGIDDVCNNMVKTVNIAAGLDPATPADMVGNALIVRSITGSWIFLISKGDCSPMTNSNIRATGFIARDSNNALVLDYFHAN